MSLGRRLLIGAGLVLGALVVLAIIGTIIGPPPPTPAAAPNAEPSPTVQPTAQPAAPAPTVEPAPTPAPAPTPEPRALPDVNTVADQLAELYPMPNRRDNTGNCPSSGCVGLVTTDAVSIYQWPDEATASRWAAGAAPADVRVVGPYVLSFRGREQQVTSTTARDAWAQRLAELTAT